MTETVSTDDLARGAVTPEEYIRISARVAERSRQREVDRKRALAERVANGQARVNAVRIMLTGDTTPAALALGAVLELHQVCPCSDDCDDCAACSGQHHADPVHYPCDTTDAICTRFESDDQASNGR